MKKLSKTLASQYQGLSPVLLPMRAETLKSYTCSCTCNCKNKDVGGSASASATAAHGVSHNS